jgi:hypothetical protein
VLRRAASAGKPSVPDDSTIRERDDRLLSEGYYESELFLDLTPAEISRCGRFGILCGQSYENGSFYDVRMHQVIAGTLMVGRGKAAEQLTRVLAETAKSS